jgi:hypothetical protein
MNTYSFLDTVCSLFGPGGSINLGAGAAVAEEGITIEANGDIDTLAIGADGTPMHSLHADKSGTLTVRLQKTSPVNEKLSQMYAFQTATSQNHGQNTITLANTVSQDVVTCQMTAFKKAPSLTYAKEAGLNEWVFSCGRIDRTLGGVT